MYITLRSTIFIRIIFRYGEYLTKHKEIKFLTMQCGILKIKSLKNYEVHVDCCLVVNDVLWSFRWLPTFQENLYTENGGDIFLRTLVIAYKTTRRHSSGDYIPHFQRSENLYLIWSAC
jgi:hypothetical protein